MIAFKHTKCGGAEYLSHLDLLRHIDRTLRRAHIKVGSSGGFHPHPKIFMNNPLALGVESYAEYCAADADFTGDFKEVFNFYSPDGIKCIDFKFTDKNPNYANTVTGCVYTAEGIAPFNTDEYLLRKEIKITDLRDRETDIRGRIYGLEFKDGKLYFKLGCGQNNLRPDLFAKILQDEFGGCARKITKISAVGEFTF